MGAGIQGVVITVSRHFTFWYTDSRESNIFSRFLHQKTWQFTSERSLEALQKETARTNRRCIEEIRSPPGNLRVNIYRQRRYRGWPNAATDGSTIELP